MDLTTPETLFDCYECEDEDCDLLDDPSLICEDAIYCWKSTVRGEDGAEENARGCIGNAQQVRFMCNSKLSKGGSQYHIECCQGPLCNGDAFPVLQPPDISELESTMSPASLSAVILAPLLVVAVLILVAFACFRRDEKGNAPAKERRNEQLREPIHQLGGMDGAETNEVAATQQAPSSTAAVATTDSTPAELKVTSAGDSTIKDYFDGQSLTSGSGSGLPHLMQRTFAKQISLIDRLNRGGFGYPRDLWRGVWQGECVAVKIFGSRSEQLWSRETEVYTRLLPSKHDYVLGYLGSDTTSAASCTQLWIVTHYHPNGSLRNYLRERRLDGDGMFKACLNLSCGLLYLHTEIHGTRGKVSMAHRNICSKNVLVKSDGSCVIADFGCAATQDRLGDTTFFEHASKRYMSPELLDRTFVPQSLESFRQADIYSLGLVFWEICRRCVSTEDVDLDYAAPYSALLTNGEREPTLDEMLQLVVTEERRPEIPEHWQSDEMLAGMEAIIKECWQTKATARLPILRVKKMLIKLAPSHSDVDSSLD